MKKIVAAEIKKAPARPGVYVFYRRGKPIYVGKAANLRNRLAAYLPSSRACPPCFARRGGRVADAPKPDSIGAEADRLKYKKLSSGAEALIEESKLIKKLQPAYNVLMRDDKSYFYVIFTRPNFSKKISGGQAREKFPRIFVSHKNFKPPASGAGFEAIGPFTEGRSLKLVLRTLRRSFPHCSCFKPHRRFCLNAQIKNCPGFCCRIGEKAAADRVREYRRNIKTIKDFLLGRKKFSDYPRINDRIKAFDNVMSHKDFVESSVYRPAAGGKKINRAECPGMSGSTRLTVNRAECYDVSHFGGKEAVGAMTVWIRTDEGWSAEKESWRKFRIKTAGKGDDPGAVAEIVSRRLRHAEWPIPGLMIIDGGPAQLSAAAGAVKNFQKTGKIKVISFAKPGKKIFGWTDRPIPADQLPDDLRRLVAKAVHYTHSFVIRYHRSKRFLSLRPET